MRKNIRISRSWERNGEPNLLGPRTSAENIRTANYLNDGRTGKEEEDTLWQMVKV